MTDRPSLGVALQQKLQADIEAADKLSEPERAARRAQLEADAKLYNTPAWDVLPAARRHLVALYVRQEQRQGGSDAA